MMSPDSSVLAVKVQGLRKSYGSIAALQGVDFEAPVGAVTAFLGPNGAGKTTAIRILTGSLLPDAGSVHLFGADALLSGQDLKKRVGYLPENNPLWPEMTVEETLAFAWSAQGRVGHKMSAVERVVVSVGLEPVFRRRIQECSKGFRQRVGLAQALIHDPELVILDEPTNGLDPLQVIQIRELVRELGRQKTVLLTTHVLPEVEALADRVVLLHEGKKVVEGTLAEVTSAKAGQQQFKVTVNGSEEDLKSMLATAGVTRLESGPPSSSAQAQASAVVLADGGQGIFEAAVKHDLVLLELTPRSGTLESLFYGLTQAEGLHV
jgi:ABC-2 type transport system ATP-binding protein